MASTQKDDIASLQLDVAVIKNDMKYVRSTLDKLSVVSQEEFHREMAEVKKRLDSLEQTRSDNAVGSTFSNLFASKVFGYIIAAILAASLWYIGKVGGQ